MKYQPLIYLVISLLPVVVNSQEKQVITKTNFDFAVSLGNSFFTNLLQGSTHQISPYFNTQVNINIPLKTFTFITTGIGYEANRHLVDGFFSKIGNSYNFQTVPFNYTQNEILLDYFNVPVLLKHDFNKNPDANFNLGIGPVFSYLVASKQSSKINGMKVESDAPIENKFRYGMCLDFNLKRQAGKMKTKGVVGWGIYYQFSRHLKDKQSFQPFAGYFRFGIGT
jgi:hypothetical protein